QVAVVTGGASGIGRAVVELFVEAGVAGLAVIDIAECDLSGMDVDVVTGQFDVSDSDAVGRFVSDVHDRFGRIDILVNNAGVAPVVPWSEVTEANWQRVLDVNLNGAFHCTRSVWSHMRDRQYGRIVNISSVGAFLGSVSAHPAYGVSKAGLIALTKSLAKEGAADGILVNAIAPGSIDTPMLESFGPEARVQYAEAALLKRQATPKELAETIVFLVSPASSYITGATLHVNGGALLV
ncbi:MAG: SDR family NAD(P)-dependent oxidoreductase, partial [Planctomycetota bacterium]|nr:SDR family NAD(P)-dependent oxidoreductase [Planctomycetota bacterium]